MTEEIIINGVNVAGCCCIENGFCLWVKKYYETGITPKCEQVKDCYYKQLKSLEQENETLKDNNNHLQVIIDDGRAENKRFREENKELKKQIRLYDCIDKWGTEQCHCACRCLGNEFCEDADKKINTYRSALEDINILVKNYCNACDEFKVKTYKNKNDCLYCNYGFIKRKIDEVLK